MRRYHCLNLLMFLCPALTLGCFLQMDFILDFPSPDTHDSTMKMSGSHRFSADTVSLLMLTHSSGFQLMKALSHFCSQGSRKQVSNCGAYAISLSCASCSFLSSDPLSLIRVPNDHGLSLLSLSSHVSLVKSSLVTFFQADLKYNLKSLGPRNIPIYWPATIGPFS